MNSARGFLRPPFSGTLTTVPSSIFSRACTPVCACQWWSHRSSGPACLCGNQNSQLPACQALLWR